MWTFYFGGFKEGVNMEVIYLVAAVVFGLCLAGLLITAADRQVQKLYERDLEESKK